MASLGCLANSVAERIALVEDEVGLRVDVRASRDAWINPSIFDGHQTLENAAGDAFLAPYLAFAQFSVGIEASELGAGARAARGTVVGAAGAQDKIFAVRFRGAGRPIQLDVVDLLFVIAGDPVGAERLPDAPGEIGQLLDPIHAQDLPMLGDEVKPVAAPRDISHDPADSRNFHLYGAGLPIAGDIPESHAAVLIEMRFDHAGDGIEPECSQADLAQMRQRRRQPDSTVAAHVEIADIVEE